MLIPVARTVPGGAVPGPVTVGGATLPSLQGGGFIAGNTVDRNAYGHSHAVMVRQTAAGSVEALVVQTGGQAVRDGDLGRIVARVGQAGGARFQNNTNPAMAVMVQGGGGSWVADSGTWTAGGVTPQVSRAAASVSFGNAAMLSDFLNRFDIGIPEANTMRTAMNMGGNDLNNVNAMRANQAVLQNGGVACSSNATGCSFWISDDGRFSDFNDGWIRYQGAAAGAGFVIQGPAGGGNLWVQDQGIFQGDLSTRRTVWAQEGARLGRDASGNPTGAGFLDVSGNAWVSGNTQTGALSVVGNSWTGGNASVVGTLGAAQVWTNYVNSSGNADFAGAVNIGQSASIWGAGGLYVAANITTPGSIFGGYMRSTGSVDAGNDLNAVRNVTAQTGRVFGGSGVQTGTWRAPNAWCNWGGGEAGLMSMSNVDGSLLTCVSNWTWRAPTSNSGLGAYSEQVIGGWSDGATEFSARRITCMPGYQVYYSRPPDPYWGPLPSWIGNNTPVFQCVGDATPPGLLQSSIGIWGPFGQTFDFQVGQSIPGGGN